MARVDPQAAAEDWQDLISARLYRLKLDELPAQEHQDFVEAVPKNLPPAGHITIFNASARFHFMHVIKTGGESLELHLSAQPSPKIDYGPCRSAAVARAWPQTTARLSCATWARAVSLALCGLNCECCASDILHASLAKDEKEGGFLKGTLLRSPRAHVLSLFSHCHAAHHNNWQRIWDDFPQYAAEGLLRATEAACDSHCTHFEPEPLADLRSQLENPNRSGQVEVIPFLRNIQSHALTCSTAHGNLGQHFRDTHFDESLPSLEGALATLRRFDWVGLTDLYEHSVCLLHFQANGSLPPSCDCSSSSRFVLPKFTHGHRALAAERLQPDILARIDASTTVDAQLFAEALRLLLGRLKAVEALTGAQLLRCIPWRRLWRRTRYIPGLWLDSESYAAGFRT